MHAILDSVPIQHCVRQASVVNKIHPDIIKAVIQVEGGYAGAQSRNKNASYDLGLMQINDRVWIPLISKKLFAGDYQRAYNKVKDDNCLNIFIGTWILAQAIKDEKGDVWQGVGRYHSATPSLKKRYQSKVLAYLSKNKSSKLTPDPAIRAAITNNYYNPGDV